MSDVALKVEGLGKRYGLRQAGGTARYRTLRDELAQLPSKLWSALRSNPAPNDFWALWDVSFEVKRGEVLGVIGRNGAGKSTLLKILSRIVEPTAGQVDIYGRVGSLLEVGTGFHPELTGRENIFLSGAILGMRRHEVRARLDEIVAFAEIERFLDQPVKHYSSGMYARLGFAVAAHLNPEILIVDEILAVGDQAFQERCIGRMKQAAKGEGRTVIVVSHNMAMIQTLCSRALYLSEGMVSCAGNVTDCINSYVKGRLGDDSGVILPDEHRRAPSGGGQRAIVRRIELRDSRGVVGNRFAFGEAFELRVRIAVSVRLADYILGFSINTREGQVLLCSNHYDSLEKGPLAAGEHVFSVVVDHLYLAPGTYSITWAITAANQHESHDFLPECGLFHVEARTMDPGAFASHFDLRPGLLRPPMKWRKTA